MSALRAAGTAAVSRRRAVALLAAWGALVARRAHADDGFLKFLETLWPAASAKEVRRATFDAVVAGLTPDPSAPKATGQQPEFDKPLPTYVQEAVNATRVARGRQLAAQYASVLRGTEQRFGVPGEICLAAWAMESDFGRARGQRDIVRTLATLAYTRPDRPIFTDEFVASLVILDRGLVPRERLRGSWAGAMGDPQFLPSAYLKYGVSFDGSGAPDIWTNPADVLASIANFLHAEGWSAADPFVEPVRLPDGFSVPTLHATATEWARLGLRDGDGRAPSGQGNAALFLPAGAPGPAFLLFPNYFVIKQYNNSDSYALSLSILAQRIAGSTGSGGTGNGGTGNGGTGIVGMWPSRPVNLSRSDKSFIQGRLAALGLYDGPRDGKLGPKARDAIHAYQKSVGLTPADGFATPALVKRLHAHL